MYRKIFLTLFCLTLLAIAASPVTAQEGPPTQQNDAIYLSTISPQPAWLPETEIDIANFANRKRIPSELRASSATFNVNTTVDSVDANPGNGSCSNAFGQCSLRAAVMESNARTGDEYIYLKSATYLLTIPGDDTDTNAAVGDLDITSADGLSIYGKFIGAPTIISGNHGQRIFELPAAGAVYLGNLTLVDGYASEGGALRNFGYVSGYNLTFTNNYASAFGGAIANRGTLYLSEATLNINTTDITTGYGGAIHNREADPAVYASMTLYNVTFSGNAAWLGGAVYTGLNADSYLRNNTIVHNTASYGGGIRNYDGESGYTIIYNTILALNTVSNPANGHQCFGILTTGGGNVLGDLTGCTFSSSGDSTNTDPMIAALTSNGGRVLTHATMLGSPARDWGYNSSCTGMDARGVWRVQDGNYNGYQTCDAGAYEATPNFTLFAPLVNEQGHDPFPSFGWTGKTNAAKYTLEIQGIDNPFHYTITKPKASICNGIVCWLEPALVNLPGANLFQWRVISITSTGAKTFALWHPFSTQIPNLPYVYDPVNFSTLTDTTPYFSWDYGYNVTSYKLVIMNATTNAMVKSFTFKNGSSPSIWTICSTSIYYCQFSTDQIGKTLPNNKSYKWQLTAYATYSWKVGGVTITKKYPTSTPWYYFTLTNNPTIQNNDQQWIPLPPAK